MVNNNFRRIFRSVALTRYFAEYKRRKQRMVRAMSYYEPKLSLIREWAKAKTEFSNYLYPLEESNLASLSMTLSLVLNESPAQIREYFLELQDSPELHSHISKYFESNLNLVDSQIEFSRRLGWYAVVRSRKPKLVVETGVALGVGSCVLCAALSRNEIEGFPGRYIGTEIDLSCGGLFTEPFSNHGQIRFGDSIETLAKIDEIIDVFINDSDHNPEYELREYEVIKTKMNDQTIIIGDNCHVSDSLMEFSELNSRRFLYFQEKPLQHWYPGAGMGISFIG